MAFFDNDLVIQKMKAFASWEEQGCACDVGGFGHEWKIEQKISNGVVMVGISLIRICACAAT